MGVEGDGGVGEIVLRRVFGFEIAEPVDAANERRAVARSHDLPNMGRKVANGEADPALCRRIGIRAVNQANMMQGHLAGLKREHHCVIAIDVHRDLLAACQQIVRPRTCRDARPARVCCVSGMTRMAPFSAVLSDSATQAVTMSAGSSPQ